MLIQMIIDKNNIIVTEKAIIRKCNDTNEFMVTSISSVNIKSETVYYIIMVNSMCNKNYTTTLLYVTHPISNKWLLLDRYGNEWEIV